MTSTGKIFNPKEGRLISNSRGKRQRKMRVSLGDILRSRLSFQALEREYAEETQWSEDWAKTRTRTCLIFRDYSPAALARNKIVKDLYMLFYCAFFTVSGSVASQNSSWSYDPATFSRFSLLSKLWRDLTLTQIVLLIQGASFPVSLSDIR